MNTPRLNRLARPAARKLMLLSLALLLGAGCLTRAGNMADHVPQALQPGVQTAEWAVKWWGTRHEQKLEELSKGPYDVLLVGDSITHHWDYNRDVWEEFFGEYRMLNLGFSGDRTENVLWRLQNGEVAGISPKVAVLMIGTNNTGHRQDPAGETAAGVQAILAELKARLPETRILLLAIFPRAEAPDNPLRVLNRQINDIIKGFADGERVVFLDINEAFLEEDGRLSREVMPDLLHPNKNGYRIWSEAMGPVLQELLKE